MSTAGGAQTWLLECNNCGAKISASGTTSGGNPSCTHAFGPIGGYTAPPKKGKRKIVYPTDAERKWLRIIDQNKDENEKHTVTFEKDQTQLAKLHKEGMEAIKIAIQALQTQLEERQEELEGDLNRAFEERKEKIKQNMAALEQHKTKNEETKDNAEDLLESNDKEEAEREKIIVGECENVINTTPQIKYIPTKLQYTFTSLKTIQGKIEKFGKLNTNPVTSGNKCDFDSMTAATKAPAATPKEVNLDDVLVLQLKNSTFDPKAKKVKLSFKVNPKKGNIAGIDDPKKHLKVHVFCAEDDEDQKGEDTAPIHEETVDFSTCKPLKNKFEISINHQFQPGLTIAFKLRPKFATPDETKWQESFGKWSREQTIDIPDDDVTFTLELNGKQQKLKLQDDDKALTDFKQFEAKFLGQFNQNLKSNQTLFLSTDDGVLDGQSQLTKYATESYIIRGQITVNQPKEEIPPAAYTSSPKVASPKVEEPGGGGGGGQPGADLANAPKQISTIVVFSDTKKRVVLKKKNNEYTISSLKEKVVKKLKTKGLSGDFQLETKEGTRISDDNAIITYLANYEGELKVIKG
mmetsp:Transcript_13869/g.12421  ORF Transcript_13869/g.12421 Transcript_13869/m.12421 type:complete len:577 (+) Transcript_13869:106-1836(+)